MNKRIFCFSSLFVRVAMIFSAFVNVQNNLHDVTYGYEYMNNKIIIGIIQTPQFIRRSKRLADLIAI